MDEYTFISDEDPETLCPGFYVPKNNIYDVETPEVDFFTLILKEDQNGPF